jgi:hypothetical protein
LTNFTNADINQFQIVTLKNQTNSIIDKIVKNINFTGNSSTAYIFGNNMLSSQISLSDTTSTELANEEAIKNNLTIVNPDKCIETLKKYYNTSDDFIISKTQYNSLLKSDSKSLSDSTILKIYDYKTRAEVNMSLCQDDDIIYKIPMSENLKASLNLTAYQLFNQSGIDAFNPNSTFFTSVCSPYIDNSTQYDTTLNYRRQNYFQNKTFECVGLDCQYEGLDANFYIQCSCKPGVQPSSPEVFDNTVDFFLQSLSKWNFEIITCYMVVFIPGVIYNIGFYVMIVLLSMNTLILVLVNMFIKTEIKLDIEKIIYYDCKFFNKGSMGANNYFNRGNNNIQTEHVLNKNNELFSPAKPQMNRKESIEILNLNKNINKSLDDKNDDEGIIQHNNFFDNMHSENNHIGERRDENENEGKQVGSEYNNPITIGDYEQLGPLDIIRYDKRSICKYLTDRLIMDHTIVSLIFKKSLFDPFFIRILKLVFQVSLQFCTNALLFTDDYIDARGLDGQKVNSLIN